MSDSEVQRLRSWLRFIEALGDRGCEWMARAALLGDEVPSLERALRKTIEDATNQVDGIRDGLLSLSRPADADIAEFISDLENALADVGYPAITKADLIDNVHTWAMAVLGIDHTWAMAQARYRQQGGESTDDQT